MHYHGINEELFAEAASRLRFAEAEGMKPISLEPSHRERRPDSLVVLKASVFCSLQE
jgi:hypothetical protein